MNHKNAFYILEGKCIAFHTLGCKVNAYETEAMQQSLEGYGCVIVPFETEEAPVDVYVINTCSVTNIADKKSRQMLRRARTRNPHALIVAAGCYAQIAGQELLSKGIADKLVGTNQKGMLPRILAEHFAAMGSEENSDGEAALMVPEAERNEGEAALGTTVLDVVHPVEYEEQFITRVENHTRAFMKIQEGCNQFCSYCIIPYARGRIRSRSLVSVVKEAENLAKSGVKEIVLTGIHLSSYGIDMDGTCHLIDVLDALNDVEGIERIQLGSLEPRIVTEEFAKKLASLEKVCPHFHLSLQSGSDTVLKRMNRKYTTGEYLAGCEALRRAYDNPAITTDVIVGFPGETEEEFAESRAFCQRVGFYEMHVFQYSRREGTVADRMPEQIPEAVKKIRSNELISLGQEMSERYRRYFAKQKILCQVLFETIADADGREVKEAPADYCGAHYAVGYTREYIRVAVPVSEKTVPGSVAEVILKENVTFGSEEIMLAELSEL